MAARAWVVFIVGIIGVYVAYTMLGGLVGFIFGLYDTITSEAEKSGIQIPEGINQTVVKLKSITESVWSYAPLLTFIAMGVYLMLESMRRRPEDYYA